MLTWGGRGAPAFGRTGPGATRRAAGAAAVPALAGVLVALLLAVGASVPATAAGRADPGADCPAGQNDCSVWDDEPGTPGGPGGGDTGGDGDSGGGDSGGGTCQWNGRTVACYDDVLGWFNNGDGCYYKLAQPQPENTPEGKQWYVQTCSGGDISDQRPVLLDAAPPGFGAPPDPEEIARRLLARITITAPRIAVAPRKDIGPGLVGLPVWMWASDKPEHVGPEISRSRTEQGLYVELTATFDRIVWDMGNGDTVTCTGAGTEYRANSRYAGRPSPDCGYDKGYPKASPPGGYQVRATTHWTVTWRGGDESGVIPLTRTTGVVRVRINELQVVAR